MTEPCCTHAGLEMAEEAWPLPIRWIRHLLRVAQVRGVPLIGVQLDESSGWCLCPAEELLQRIEAGLQQAWVTQRPGCGGLFTTVAFTNGDAHWGSWLADRPPGEPEPAAWRASLLELLVLASMTTEDTSGSGAPLTWAPASTVLHL